MSKTKIDLDTVLADFGMDVVHVPTKMDHSEGAWNALKYVVTIFYKQRLITTTNYSMGVGHIPGYSLIGFRGRGMTIHEESMVNTILAKGAGEIISVAKQTQLSLVVKPIRPKLVDVMYSLLSDGSAIDHADFESWAQEYGYDTDSRKAEATYRLCLDIGLKFRAVLGEAKLAEMREAFQDY